MQAVILAAGNSSRFIPFNESFKHKSLVKIAGRTIIEHTLLSIKKSGIDNVILVVNDIDSFKNEIGEGENMGLKITYVLLPEALGMGAALLKAEEFLEEKFFVVNATHVDFYELIESKIDNLEKLDKPFLIGKKEENLEKYGYFKFENKKVLEVSEKPESKLENALRIVGIYFLDKEFVNILKTLPQDHYNFEKALDNFAKKFDLEFFEIEKEVISLKYGFDLFSIKNYILNKLNNFISEKAEISKSAIIENNVFIEEGVKVLENAVIKGPCFIGKNAVIGTNALVRNKSCIEENAVVGSNIEVKNSLIMKNTTTHSGLLEDSILGQNCRIAAGVLTANVRLDRSNIKSEVKGEKVDTGLKYFGILVGSNTDFGVRITTMPGIIIGSKCLIGPSTIVMKNLEKGTKFYTTFNEIVEKNE